MTLFSQRKGIRSMQKKVQKGGIDAELRNSLWTALYELKATLGPTLKEVSAKTPLHPAFEKALLALYGFTSDEHSIRHSLLEEPNLHYSDAKFMLVLASGFCSFLLAKCAENGVKLKGLA